MELAIIENDSNIILKEYIKFEVQRFKQQSLYV